MADHEDYTKSHSLDGYETGIEYIVSECQEARIGVMCKMGASFMMFPAVTITQIDSSSKANKSDTEKEYTNKLQQSSSSSDHNADFNENASSEFVLYSCEMCSDAVVVLTLDELKDHVYSFHLNAEDKKDLQASKQQHIETYQDYYTCEKCSGVFFEKYKLDLHVKYAHKHGLIECKQCGQKIKNLHNQNVHRCSYVLDAQFTCNFCNKRFVFKHILKQHQTVHTGTRPWSCNICDKKYINFLALVHHKSISHVESTKSSIESEEERRKVTANTNIGESNKICVRYNRNEQSTDETTGNCEEGITEFNGVQNIDCNGSYNCAICGKIFLFKTALKMHMFLHTGDKQCSCNLCGEFFSEECNLIKHKRLCHAEEIKTSVNSKISEFQTSEQLATDVNGMSSSNENINDDTNIQSVKTAKEFAKGMSIGQTAESNEMENVRLDKRIETLMGRIKNCPLTSSYDCHVCNRNFKYRNNLKRHLAIHASEVPYPCEFCREDFRQIDDLEAHKKLFHMEEMAAGTNSGPEQLPTALNAINGSNKKVNILSSAMEKLLQRVPQSGPFDCPECGRHFPSKTNLKRHLLLHTGERPYSCEYCIKNFTDPSGLKRHKERRHYSKINDNSLTVPGSNEPDSDKARLFSCRECKKSFHFCYELNRHYLTHSDILPFVCEICGHRVRNKSKLMLHMRTHTKEKPFICKICSRSFSFQHSMKRHMNTHTRENTRSSATCITSSDDEHGVAAEANKGQTQFLDKLEIEESSSTNDWCDILIKEETQFLETDEDGNMNSVSEEGTFTCHVCHKSFYFEAILKRHMVIH